jgi:hypothetical protein
MLVLLGTQNWRSSPFIASSEILIFLLAVESFSKELAVFGDDSKGIIC